MGIGPVTLVFNSVAEENSAPYMNKAITLFSFQVAIDIEFARNMYELHKKVNPSEIIVGW